MTTEAKIQLTSTELGTLWMSYFARSSIILMCDLFKDKTIEKEAQNIVTDFVTEGQNITNKLVKIFNDEKVVIPVAFDERDVIREAPPLFDDIFNILFLRQMLKINFGHCSVYTAMSYMDEVHDLYKISYDTCDKFYFITTKYLLKKGVLARPPYVTMPNKVEFIEDKKYMSGINPFSDKRSLNTIEVGFLNEAIEDNIFGMQLMTGFAQVAIDSEVKKYFIEGKELAKKIITKLSDILLQSDIQPPSTWAGKATDSTKSPFSDKLMMYITSMLSSSAIGYNALGTSFSLRSDLHSKLILITKDTFYYAKKGGKLMIEHKWMEEPPQMEDRNQLTKL
ncbi:DUF3231 family protein [Clostridium algoriphilum]|uniref:DUF3231 family protein n=1 Tax=Clostridium algoriphilum TaxID=198347 RepID=UPI001CF46018|nr:DUF3231 family protein [Clostridium algoriphilum]MCB2294391.1 DUF3231 family protein [Clostridium algoriphilum]